MRVPHKRTSLEKDCIKDLLSVSVHPCPCSFLGKKKIDEDQMRFVFSKDGIIRILIIRFALRPIYHSTTSPTNNNVCN